MESLVAGGSTLNPAGHLLAVGVMNNQPVLAKGSAAIRYRAFLCDAEALTVTLGPA